MAPSSAAPAFHLMRTSHLIPSDFSRRSTACVRPPQERERLIRASPFAGNVRDACGPQAERRRRFELERLCGELAQDVDILCAYPVPYTNSDQALTRICAEHTAVSVS